MQRRPFRVYLLSMLPCLACLIGIKLRPVSILKGGQWRRARLLKVRAGDVVRFDDDPERNYIAGEDAWIDERGIATVAALRKEA